MGFPQIRWTLHLADKQGLPTRTSDCLGSHLALGTGQPRSIGASLPAVEEPSFCKTEQKIRCTGCSLSLSGSQAAQTAQGQAGKVSPGLSLPLAPCHFIGRTKALARWNDYAFPLKPSIAFCILPTKIFKICSF